MALRQGSPRPLRFAHAWLRPVAISAATAVAIGALFQPIPALAAPTTPPAPTVPAAPVNGAPPGVASVAVPDAGARPVQLGDLVLPGRPATTPSSYTPIASVPGTPVNPVVQRVEKGRAEIASLGDQLIRIGQDRDIAQAQAATASQRITEAQAAITQARTDVDAAAEAAMQRAAEMPPGALDSGLRELEALSRLQRGDIAPDEGAARRLKAAESYLQAAMAEQTTASQQFATLSAQWTELNARIAAKQTAQQKLERKHSAELTAAETTETAADQQLGADYLAGEPDGRGADPRALQALQFALAQRGDPYVWSEEGPDQYDCSGLMFAAYRSVGFPLVRVSRDQYYQTRNKVVDRYSLLPGDLLFFSSSNSWTGIHHVAMYAGSGMMVEAPRTGLNVRLVPVRWSRLFQATRVFGSVEGGGEAPVLGAPDPEEPGTVRPSPSPSKTTKPPAKPTPTGTSKPPTDPTPTGTSKPPTDPTPTETSKPPTDPTPTETSKPPTDPTPTTSAPSTTPAPNPSTSSSPSSGESSGTPDGSSSSSSGGGSSSGGASASSTGGASSASSTAKQSSAAATKETSAAATKESSAEAKESSATTRKPAAPASSGD